jgi:hypothetical protein
MPMPRHKDDLLPLDQLITFIRPPSDIIDTMISNIKDIEISAWNAVWGTETTSLSDVAKSVTATEMNITQDSKYDKLFSCAEHLCEFWNFNVDIITRVTNMASNLSFFMSVGKEFSIKSTYELTAEFKIQKENGMSSDVYRKTEREIIRIQYSNEPYYVRKYDVKVRFKPFSDKTVDQINIILADKTETTLQDRVLWKNYDQIFDNLEMNNDQLYDKSFKEIKSLIVAEVDRLIVEIKSQETTTPNLSF